MQKGIIVCGGRGGGGGVIDGVTVLGGFLGA